MSKSVYENAYYVTIPETTIYIGEDKKALEQLDKDELIEFVRNLLQENQVLRGKYEVLKASHFGARYEGEGYDSPIRRL